MTAIIENMPPHTEGVERAHELLGFLMGEEADECGFDGPLSITFAESLEVHAEECERAAARARRDWLRHSATAEVLRQALNRHLAAR